MAADSEPPPGSSQGNNMSSNAPPDIPLSPGEPSQGQSPASPLDFAGPDRVYPIRSIISVDRPQGLSGVTGPRPVSPAREGARAYSIIDEETWNQLQEQPVAEGGGGGGGGGDTIEDSQEMDGGIPKEPEPEPEAEAEPEPEPEPETSEALSPELPKTLDPVEGNTSGLLRKMSLSITQTMFQANTLPSKEEQEREPQALVTARFQHVEIEGGHAVITGRGGESFQFCEDEPIHIPGAVQSFGVLVALQEDPASKGLLVRVVSENSKAFLGYSPNELFALESFTDILSDEQADNFLDHVDFVRDEACDPSIDGPEVFVMSITIPGGRCRRFWCAVHIHEANHGLVICELELEDDPTHPLNVSGETTPMLPSDTLGIEPTPEELAASTINISQPLRILRNARRRRGEAAAMEVFSILSQIQEQLARAQTLDALLNTATGLVKELTGFHRVMIYQFDSSWNGIVIAELVDPRATKDLYKGLRFPASDIPKQARDLYKINKVRLLYDRDLVTARLVCRTLQDLETPLDLTHAYLRAMSPIHVKYLANMAVRSSMSISINAFNELWGLISCHSYGNTGMRVSFPIRKMCRLIGDTVSRNIERLSYASRLQARKLINTVPTEANPSGYIIASSDDLLNLFGADYGALSIRDETKILGKLTHSQEVLALLEYLKMRQINSVLASQDVRKDFPDLRYPPGFKHISGLLYVPLSSGGSDFIVFFRRGQLMEIKWAGNPYEKQYKKGTTAYLEPRKSFQTWRETVMNQSREWSESDVETAAVLCLVYGKFIKVWRQKEAAMESSQLTRLLLANSAHEVRTPLNAIINYLEIALEGPLDHETRDNLAKSHSASKSLIYVINDLLDLTNTEKGQELIKDESFDLCHTIREATDMFEPEAKRKGIGYSVTVHPGLPTAVLGDQRRVRQVVMNLISNAIQHTLTGSVAVDIWRSPVPPESSRHVPIEITVLDTGTGMSQSTLETLFHDLEQVSMEDDSYLYEGDSQERQQHEQEQQSIRAIEDAMSLGEANSQRRVLGLGLALVSRIVRNMHGQMSVKSEEGNGSRFKILLQFAVPDSADATPATTGAPKTISSTPGLATEGPATPPTTEGDFMLVNRGSGHRSGIGGRRYSGDSGHSEGSFRSSRSSRSGKSEADRLISAMQEPPLINRTTSEGSDIRRLHNNTNNNTRPGSPTVVRNTPASPASASGALPVPTIGLTPTSPPTSSNNNTTTTTTTFTTAFNDRFRRASYESLSTTFRSLVPLTTPPAPGQEPITDSGVPLSALRIEPQDIQRPPSPPTPAFPSTSLASPRSASASTPTQSDLLRILVAEDDPINSKIVHKRLSNCGHGVRLTINGEECAAAFEESPSSYDAVLMDIQMPIVDGMAATRRIREHEASTPAEDRVPVFAVSASLVERDMQKYIDCGFDGWIMKPIDFHRLNIILDGVQAAAARAETVYQPGRWEHGGWFTPLPLIGSTNP
ncbi:hypothetical protein ASPZODRAFT_11575 [Penicilliopsis zonata CBS 506.65]|uniref:Phytochrome n=1 Tax=Penicilliopsis zonata CBS 506.65 TaxID=1073090 RepID=A0A1L9SU37_9EURO|nr:hypothetical protein ASPZODRAFT_11575 [Penicilliopsis zonata CBS 506.65]OJJ50720.1 hypothetical protein ASPZODRAFT_11575 [Penicilliopsis zonata CBS 506.65]